jgi:hypothetical protein
MRDRRGRRPRRPRSASCERLAELPKPLRRLRTFRELFQVNRLKPGLAAFVEGGRYSFFDAEEDSFGLDWWTCFE